jgi:hypothetical protein
MIFNTHVNGIPCQCSVLTFNPGTPAQTSGPPEHCHDGDPGEFEFELLDRRGHRAAWLDRYINPQVEDRLLEEAHVMRQGEEREAYYQYDYA